MKMVLENIPNEIDSVFDLGSLFAKEQICSICNVCNKAHLETKKAVVLFSEVNVNEAIQTMRKNNTDYVIIINNENQPIGIFTSLDIMPLLTDNEIEICHKPITEFMTLNPTSLYCYSSISDVIKTIYKNKYRHVPIIKKESKIIRGVISLSDIIKYTLEYFPESAYNVSPTPNLSKDKIEGA
ncbi:MAG: Inosine-5'-monophosphate dehydrogenase [Candidatus Heimdallarchaeota archaeon LC_3]|nr:MAG: Inosine-5'-monophosphate dehydrogenase [Candidatus Heimdallarchaeota archaeon LC_3]